MAPVLPLPGVGENLQGRYSEMSSNTSLHSGTAELTDSCGVRGFSSALRSSLLFFCKLGAFAALQVGVS